MCEICRKMPCDSRCPNAPDPLPVYACAKCGSDIFGGEIFYDSPEGPICMDCMDSMTTIDILELIGEKCSVAEMEGMYGL